MELLDGKAMAATIKDEVAQAMSALGGRRPTLALVRVGEDPASRVYVKSKAKACEHCGIESRNVHLDDDVSEEKLLGVLREFNEDSTVDGILLQLPLPAHIDSDRAIRTISPLKDVDGFHPLNIGALAMKGHEPDFTPCTPSGVIEMIDRTGVPIEGANAVVLGRSNIVGMPVALLLIGRSATVTVCHSRTKDLASITRNADILIAAIGRAHFVSADMIKPGATVIDVGTNMIDDASRKSGRRLVGDVDYQAALEVAGAITPVPGGVGPMTIAMLIQNTLRAAQKTTG